jgi:hypothetical protein
MAIKNRKKLLILALLIFNTPFGLSIASKKKGCLQLLILALQFGSKRRQRHARGRTHTRAREMAVGVLALQGSFREHIACEFCFSVFLFTKKYKENFTLLLFHASVGICGVLLQVLGIPECKL